MQYKPSRSISVLRQHAVTEAFNEAIGTQAFIITADYPFMFSGEVTDIQGYFLFLKVETTQMPELKDKIVKIHISNISVFYLGGEGRPKIPTIEDLHVEVS